MGNSFYSGEELLTIGLKTIGKNVLISRFARFYSPDKIEIGNNVRIDDFCILSGEIKLRNYIHISAYSALYGKYGIEMEDFSGLSPRCTIFSSTDDFSGDFYIGPMIDQKYTNVYGGIVRIGKYSQLGCNCVVLPGVTIFEGVAVGAMSLVTEDLHSWKIYRGIPATYLKDRGTGLLKLDIVDLK
jgi:acetyltransferase-like isoleucine patch superfamily enzyme